MLNLKKAGLRGVKVGIESSNLEVLKNANRFTVTKDTQVEKVKFLESNNIEVSAMYIIGYPEIQKNYYGNFKLLN